MAKAPTKKVVRTAKANKRSQADRYPAAAKFLANAAPSVRTVMAATTDLPTFRATTGELTRAERLRILDQALVLIEQNYVHLPLKEAMHAVDPIQRLRLLQHQHQNLADDQLPSELEFHRELSQTFHSVRDLHTNYILPAPYNQMTAFVPFLVEDFIEDDQRRFLVTRLFSGFDSPPFEPGVEILSWNGIPIERAVEINGDRFAGSNVEARRARGLATLTVRPLHLSLPPDEDRVIVRYRTLDNRVEELRVDWLVFTPDDIGAADAGDIDLESAAAMGVDIELDHVNRAKKVLFAPNVVAQEKKLAQKIARQETAEGDFEERVPPSVIDGRAVDTPSGSFGYIRLRSFSFRDRLLNGEQVADAIVGKFLQLAEQLPQEGLIIDVRGNGGGIIWAGERLLQLLTPQRIEPERLQFLNTPLNLELCRRRQFLSEWIPSISQSIRTGATYSSGFPITTPASANAIGQRYHGPVVLITDGLCYSTTDIFAAGFQDHAVGIILGVDRNTGAGGANVWEHGLLRQIFPSFEDGSPYESLPSGANMRVSIRRTLRVRDNAGTPVEDLGVVPDLDYELTRDDLMNDNVDLINRAGAILAESPVRRLRVVSSDASSNGLTMLVDTLGVTRLDIFADDRPQGSIDMTDGETELTIPTSAADVILLEGYDDGRLVASRRFSL